MSIVIKAKCVGCAHVWDVRAGDVAPGDMPECPKCHSFGIAVQAESQKLCNSHDEGVGCTRALGHRGPHKFGGSK